MRYLIALLALVLLPLSAWAGGIPETTDGTKPSITSMPDCAGADKALNYTTATGTYTCTTISGGGGTGLPVGAIVLIRTGTCPTGYTEVAGLDGRFLRGTVAANADVGTTGGADTVTTVISHTHAVTVTDTGHTHVETNNSATTGSLAGWAARDTSTSTQVATGYSTQSATTGITASTSNPAGSVASIDNRPAFTRVIFCEKN